MIVKILKHDSSARFRILGPFEKQMAARRITEAEVEAVVADPDMTSPGKSTPERGATKVLWKTVEGRRLKVVVTGTDPPKVITVAAPDE